MFNVLLTVFIIFGTIVGAGFASGNEIIVFFTRFGQVSYLFIALSGVLLFFATYFLLRYGGRIENAIKNNRFLNFLYLFVSIVFCATMFAGIESLLEFFPVWLHIIFLILTLLCCTFVTVKGIGGIEKINLFIMPVLMIAFLIVLLFCFFCKGGVQFDAKNNFFGFWFCVLYVALNTSMNVFVLSELGGKLNKKQTFYASLFSTIILVFFLFMANYVLLSNSESFVSEMPILFVSGNNFVVFLLEFIVILLGCFSTLISLCFTIKNSFKKLIKNNLFCNFSSIFLPYTIGSLGFSEIISYLYPICSIIGIFIILFSIFFFKQRN